MTMYVPSSIRLTKKQVLKTDGDSKPRSHCPKAMPATAGTSIARAQAAVEPEKAPDQTAVAEDPKKVKGKKKPK